MCIWISPQIRLTNSVAMPGLILDFSAERLDCFRILFYMGENK